MAISMRNESHRCLRTRLLVAAGALLCSVPALLLAAGCDRELNEPARLDEERGSIDPELDPPGAPPQAHESATAEPVPMGGQCPAPQPAGEVCAQQVVYAQPVSGGPCCFYPTPCAAPSGWERYADPSCAQGADPMREGAVDDGPGAATQEL